MKNEPVVTAAAIVGLVQAAVVLAVSMGWINLSPEQQNNVYAFVAALLALLFPLLGAWYARGRTIPTSALQSDDGEPVTPASVRGGQRIMAKVRK